MNRRSQSGFTLLEMLVTIVVAGVILGIGVPNLMEFQRNNAMTAAANDFVTSVLAARSEAVKRSVPVTLCASPDPLADPPACAPTGAGTNGGFVVWVEWDGTTDPNTGAPVFNNPNLTVDADEPVLRRVEAPGGQIDLFMDGGYLTYAPGGFAMDLGVNNRLRHVLYCDDRGRGIAAGGRSAAALVQVQVTGRAEVVRDIALVADGIDDIDDVDASVVAGCP